jgi:hypothetical protein
MSGLTAADKQEVDDALLGYLSACEEYVRLQLAVDKCARKVTFRIGASSTLGLRLSFDLPFSTGSFQYGEGSRHFLLAVCSRCLLLALFYRPGKAWGATRSPVCITKSSQMPRSE